MYVRFTKQHDSQPQRPGSIESAVRDNATQITVAWTDRMESGDVEITEAEYLEAVTATKEANGPRVNRPGPSVFHRLEATQEELNVEFARRLGIVD